MQRPSASQFARGMAGILELPCTAVRLDNGNTLIVDAGDEIRAGSEVIEVDYAGNIVWNYRGDERGLLFAHSAVRMRNGNTLIADTTNDRVLEVSPQGQVVWSTDSLGDGSGTLGDGSHLTYPNNALELPDGTFLITDRNNDRCLILDRQGNVSWQNAGNVKRPHNAELLDTGNFLIADSDANRIVEFTRQGEEVWVYGDGSPEMLNWPRHARRLADGNTLITDSKNSRIVEVTPEGETAWEYKVDYFSKFYYAEKLDNGNVLIGDQQGHRVIEVDPAGSIVWQFRNYIYPNPIQPRLRNGMFTKRDEEGWPEHWILVRRFSEGGGELIWDEESARRPLPGLEFDRDGACCLQQTLRAAPGTVYHMAARVRTQDLEGAACLQMAFVDELGAAMEDAPDIARGATFAGTTDWTPDQFEARAPQGACAMEVRLFITGKGRAWVRDVFVHD